MAFLSILARLGLDSSGFRAGVKQAQSATKGLSRDLNSDLKGAIARAFGTAAIVAAGKATIDYAGAISDLSEQLDISTDALQELDFAAQLTGSNLETFTGFLEKIAVARDDALAGNDALRASFDQLGVSLEDLRTKRLEDLTRQIGRAVQGGNAQQLIDPLKSVGGRGAAALIPAFKLGLENAAAQARDAGAIISKEDIATLDEAGDKLTILFQIMRAELAPAIIWAAEKALDLVYGIKAVSAALGEAFEKFTPSRIARAMLNPNTGAGIGELIADVLDTIGNSEAAGGVMLQREEMRNRRNAPERGSGPVNLTAQQSNAAAARDERIARLRDQLADKELKLLPIAQQRAAIEERIARLRRESAVWDSFEGIGGAVDEEDRIKLRLDMMDAEEKLKAINGDVPSERDGPYNVNAMERIGLRSASASAIGAQSSASDPQVRKLAAIEARLGRMDDGLRVIAANTGNTATAMQTLV